MSTITPGSPAAVFLNKFSFLSARTGRALILALLAITALGITTASLRHQDLTYDEHSYYDYAERVLSGEPQRAITDNSKMPIIILNVLGSRLVQPFITAHDLSAEDKVKAGRWVSILFWILTAWIIYRWGRKLYDPLTGSVLFFLFLLEPNLLAFSHLVTTDIFATWAIITSSYFFWKFLKKGGLSRGILSAVLIGIAHLAKYSGISMSVLFIVIALGRHLPELIKAFQATPAQGWKKTVKAAGYLTIFLITALIIINLGFRSFGTFTPLKHYPFISQSFRTWKDTSPIKSVPLPLPTPYLQGLDYIKYCDETGATFGNVYLLGQLKTKNQPLTGFPGYYFYCLLFKTPLAIQILFWITVFLTFVRFNKHQFLNDSIFFLLPTITFLLHYNTVNMQLGIRNILFILPLLLLFSGRAIHALITRNTLGKIALCLLCTWLFLSSLSYFPHFVSYFNELVADKTKTYKYLADSNLDFGGKGWYIEQYLKKHPGAKLQPSQPTTGRVIVNVNELVGVMYPWKYEWIRENFTPVDHVAYSFFVFDITQEDLQKAYWKWRAKTAG